MLNLTSGVIKGVKWNLVSTILNQCINIGLMLVLSRLISPGEFGLFAMIAVFQGISVILIDLGFASAIIQAKSLDQETKSTIFWLNTILGFLLFFLLFIFSSALASFYGQPRLQLICQWFGLGFVFSAIGITSSALARKRMDFEVIAKANIISKAGSAVIALILALKGYGVWALVVSALFNSFALSGCLLLLNRWMPSFIFKLKKIKPLLRFSSEYSFVSIVNYSVQKSDEVLLGKFGDVSSLGLYSTAFKLVLMPMGLLKNQIVSVLFPAFSSIQNDKGRLKNAVFSVLSYLSLISIPAICIIWLLAPEAVSILLTAEWSGIDVYIRFLALALSFEMVQFPGAILLAQGLSGKYAKLMISYRGIYFFFMFAGVLNFGTTGLLWGIVLAGALSFLPMIWYTGRSLGISVREYLSKIVGPLLISLPALLFGFYVSKYICHSSLPMMGLFIKSTAFGSCFLILLFLFGKNMREQYLEILNKFNLISSKNKL